MWRLVTRLFVVWGVCGTAALAVSPVVALGAGSSLEGAHAAEGGAGAASLEGSLVTPGSPAQGEEAQAVQEAKLMNPEAVAAREASRTKFEGLSAGQVAQTAREAFPAVIDEPAGGLPQLPAGQKITGYPTDNAAQIELGGGESGVVESLQPIAVQTSPGQRVPINLGLSNDGSSFQPVTPAVGVSIPKRLSDGVALPGAGVSVTPVDESGEPLGGSEGVVDGATVLYANTQMDTDSLVKPTANGFDAATLLRSVESPQQLFFRVGLPAGASLVAAKDGSGAVQVLDAGRTIASVSPPAARDAAGTRVPVSMSASGDTLTLTVDQRAGNYQYPIEVDPEYYETAEDEHVTGVGASTNWLFETSHSEKHQHEEGQFGSYCWGESCALHDVDITAAPYEPKEFAAFVYYTQGQSHIYRVNYSAEESNNEKDALESFIELRSKKGQQSFVQLSVSQNAINTGSIETFSEEYGNSASYEQLGLIPEAGEDPNHFRDTLNSALVYIRQKVSPTVKYNTTEPKLTVNGKEFVNVLDGENLWIGPYSGAVGFTSEETGIGIARQYDNQGYEQNLLKENKCLGVQCPQQAGSTFTYNSAMKNGRHELNIFAESSAHTTGSALAARTLNVDSENPYNLALTGLPPSGVTDEGQLHLQARATDGKAPTPSSGVKSLALALDGYTLLGGKSGSCTPGPCTVTGEWTINGQGLGAGKHKLTVVATDYAGNIEKKEYELTIHHASSVSVGPGSVDPITGALQLGASDVSIGDGSGTLSVSRSFNSRRLTAGEGGSLGALWELHVGGAQELEPVEGAVNLISTSGRATFSSNGKGGFTAPVGDEDLVLETEKKGEEIVAYLLKNPTAGTTVRYIHPSGSTSTSTWVISSTEGALSKSNHEAETFRWEDLEVEGKKIDEPKLALAPAPASVTCSLEVKEPKELAKGCRGLSFTYATKTTAAGEAPSEWGEYNGRLKTVAFTAYNPNPAVKAMETKPVAEYSYDKQGRLRAEWDPRISPALKTTYGYDPEGHVVAVDPPGQQPSLLHYGTTASDPSAGRLLSIIRPPATKQTQSKEQAELKEADERPAPVDTAAPTLSSSSPVIGTTLSISSNGTWTNSPLAYNDVWEDCYASESKETCTPIAGAVNSTYTPQARDAGYTLKALVTAVNADGATSAATAASKAVGLTAPSFLGQFGEVGEGEKGQLKTPTAAAVDPSGNLWVVDRGNDRIEEWSSTGTWLHTYGKKGKGALQFESPQGIAINPTTGNVYVADEENHRIEELNSKGEYVTSIGKPEPEYGNLLAPDSVAIDSSGNIWVTDHAISTDRVDEYAESGTFLGSFGSEGSRNGQFNWPKGLAFSGGNMYVVDDVNERVQEFTMSGDFIRAFGTRGTGEGQFQVPFGIATEPATGDLYVNDLHNNRIDVFTPEGTPVMSFGKEGTGHGEFIEPEMLAINSSGDIYVPDSANNRIQEFGLKYSANNPLPEPPVLGASAVTTIEYNVPVSGAGAPHEMTKAELEKWDQVDDPTEATAIFPPDEPMGWPAKDYKRATISYMDELGHIVNRTFPSGGTSTSEYNADNEVTRSLSADNRATALKESNPAEAADRLDTKSTYNTAGTRLESTVGPQHLVKLSSGIEKQARNHVRYYYDEGEPAGETDNVVTKTVDGAEYEGKESDIRITSTSYSGQKNLGWLLRKPTSVTTDPVNALKGTFQAAFGSVGSENGQLQKPHGVAINSSGDVYVVDNNSRVQEFSPNGEYIRKFGTEGTGNGQLKRPEGIAIASNGNVYVADTGNGRVEEFNGTGEYLAKFGEGRLSDPDSLAISPIGIVYVLDRVWSGNSVVEFSSAGQYIHEFGEAGKGVSCERNYQVLEGQGIAVSPSGNVYVASTGCNWVVEFKENGEAIRAFGEEGSGNGQFYEPEGVAVGANGDVYIADTGNSRVQEFTEGGRYLSQFGTAGSENGQLKGPVGLAVASTSEVYVADTRNNRIERFGGFSSGANLTHTTVYEPATGKVSATRSPEAGEGEPVGSAGDAFKRAVGSEGTGKEEFNEPLGVAVAPSGTVYVADYRNARVTVLSPTGAFVSQFGKRGSGNGEFGEQGPQSIGVAPNGDVYVSDPGNSRIEEFSATGEYLAKFGKSGSGNGEFRNPNRVAVAPNGNVYVADEGNYRVQVFSASGEYLEQFGSQGSGNGQFASGPSGLAVAPNGDVYALDNGDDRVEKFTAAGGYLEQFGTAGDYVWNVAVNSGGDVFMTDSTLDHVQEISPTGTALGTFGTEGSGNGQFKYPTGVAAGANGKIYVTDTSNDRLQIWTAANSADVSKAVYYTATANGEYPACGGHPEWAELPCQSQPAAQPEGGKELPVVTDTYNMWDEPETITEKFGEATRTKQIGYDNAGRLLTNEETAAGTSDTALPKVSDEYSAASGVMLKQSTTSGAIQSAYNTLGELTEYTDADASKSTYIYTIDGQVEEMGYEIGKEKYSQIYAYDPTTKEFTSLLDTSAHSFTAAYDVEGKMTSESYPNGMTARTRSTPRVKVLGSNTKRPLTVRVAARGSRKRLCLRSTAKCSPGPAPWRARPTRTTTPDASPRSRKPRRAVNAPPAPIPTTKTQIAPA